MWMAFWSRASRVGTGKPGSVGLRKTRVEREPGAPATRMRRRYRRERASVQQRARPHPKRGLESSTTETGMRVSTERGGPFSKKACMEAAARDRGNHARRDAAAHVESAGASAFEREIAGPRRRRICTKRSSAGARSARAVERALGDDRRGLLGAIERHRDLRRLPAALRLWKKSVGPTRGRTGPRNSRARTCRAAGAEFVLEQRSREPKCVPPSGRHQDPRSPCCTRIASPRPVPAAMSARLPRERNAGLQHEQVVGAERLETARVRLPSR